MATTPLSPAARRALVASAVGSFGTGFTLPFLLIYLHVVRHLRLDVASVVMATAPAVALALSPLIGTLVDRLGPWRVLMVSASVQATGIVSLTQIEQTWQAFGAAALIGAGQAAQWPAWNTLFAALSTPEQRQRLYGVQFTLINAGIGLGGIAGGLLADTSRPATFQLLYLADALCIVVSGLVLVTLRRHGGPVEASDTVGDERPGGWREVLADRRMWWVCALFVAVVVAGYAQLEAGFTAYATTVSVVSTRVIGLAFAVNTAVIVGGQLVILRILDGRRRTRAIAGFGVAMAAAWALLGASGAVDGALSAALVLAMMAVFAAGETLWSPTGNAIVNDIAPPHLRGRYNALAGVTWQVAMVAGPILSGVLLAAGLATGYLAVLVALCAVVVLLAVALERRLTPAENGLFPPAPEESGGPPTPPGPEPSGALAPQPTGARAPTPLSEASTP